MLDQNLKSWGAVTGTLPWGVQRVLHETLRAVSDGQVSMVHGANYRNGRPCLINAAASMFTTSDDGVVPGQFSPMVVSLFDAINTELIHSGVNDDSGYVSPLAAEILVHNFGEILSPEVAEDAPKGPIDPESVVYHERTDAEIKADWQAAEDARSWLQSMNAPAPSEVMTSDDEYAKQFVEARIFTDYDKH